MYTQIYPTIHNTDNYTYGLAAFEIRGSEIYPTIHNTDNYTYGLAAFDLR